MQLIVNHIVVMGKRQYWGVVGGKKRFCVQLAIQFVDLRLRVDVELEFLWWRLGGKVTRATPELSRGARMAASIPNPIPDF